MKAGIDEAVADGKMSVAEAIAARSMARVFGSAIRALGNPNDPQCALASSLVGELVSAAAPANTPAVNAAPPALFTAFDDEGNLMPGAVDSGAPWADQLQAVRERLITQGLDVSSAEQVVADYSQRVAGEAFDAFVTAQPRPLLVAGVGTAPDVRGAREVIDTIEQRIAQGSLQGPQVGYAIEDAYEAYLRLSSSAAAAATPPTVEQERAAARLISLIGDLGHVAQQDGSTLSAEQQALVRQSRALQAQGNLPEIYGAATGGGILALRQSQRLQALQAWAAKPGLRHPNQLVGRTDGGPGQWVYAPRRSTGQDYQEQVSGVPRGVEYEVRGVKLDGYDAARRVAVDAKDWQGYPPPGTDFWQKSVVKEATGQLDVLRGTGVKLEWQVSTPQAAQQVREAFTAARLTNPALLEINVVVAPRRSGP